VPDQVAGRDEERRRRPIGPRRPQPAREDRGPADSTTAGERRRLELTMQIVDGEDADGCRLASVPTGTRVRAAEREAGDE